MLLTQDSVEVECMKARNEQGQVMTLDEVAEFLRVSTDAVEIEINSRLLPALRIGSEIRILRKDFEQFLKTKTSQPKTKAASSRESIEFLPAQPFDHRWPQRANKPKSPEKYDTAYTATVNTPGGRKRIQIGFSYSTKRRNPRLATVFADGRPMVRFKAADDFETSGLMLSIIKTVDRKQLRPDETIPAEYSGFRIEPYRTYVNETNNSKNMAIVCDKDDLQTMATHALIRANQIEERKQQ